MPEQRIAGGVRQKQLSLFQCGRESVRFKQQFCVVETCSGKIPRKLQSDRQQCHRFLMLIEPPGRQRHEVDRIRVVCPFGEVSGRLFFGKREVPVSQCGDDLLQAWASHRPLRAKLRRRARETVGVLKLCHAHHK